MLLLLFAAGSVQAAGSVMFNTQGTSDKPQSKLWYHDNLWWACLNDNSKLAIYMCTGTGWTKKLDVQNAAVPVMQGGTSDALWDGTNLFIGVFGATTSKVYKYTYDSVNQNYVAVSGFPVSLAMQTGAETIVLDKDSTGRVWAVFEANGKILVYYTTSSSHLQWVSNALQINTLLVDPDDIATVVAFGGNKIGVLWSDQRQQQVCFRWRDDTDPPATWQPIEIVRSGFGCTDDHLNMRADTQGNVYFVAKDFFDAVWVGRRDPTGTWQVTTGASGLDCGTRPMMQIDESQNKLYVFYTRWETCVSTGIHSIEERVAYLDNLLFSLPTQIISASNVSMNEVSGTKQVLPPGSLALVCSGSNLRAYWNGWGSVSGIGGSDPGGNFPPPPAPPANLAGQTVTEATQPRMLLWRLNETTGTTASDASGNNRNGTLGTGISTPHWSAGLLDGGIFFDGDDYITATGSPFAFTSSSFTLEAWVKIDLTNSPGTGMIVSRGDSVHCTFQFAVADPFIELSWSTGDTTDVSVKATRSLRDGIWHHLAAVYDRNASRARIFVDGHQEAQKTVASPTYGNNWPLVVGSIKDVMFIDKNFAGNMDLVAIANSVVYNSDFTPPILYPTSSRRYVRVSWTPATSVAGIAGYRLQRRVNGGAATPLNTTLSPNPWYPDLSPMDGFLDYGVHAVDGIMQEGTPGWVTTPFEGNPPAVPGPPQALATSFQIITADPSPFWEFDEGDGSTSEDGTGLAHTAQLGSPALSDAAEPSWVLGHTGRGLHFDGSNDYVQVADANDLRQTGSFTIEAWVRRSQLNEAQTVISKDEGSSKRNYLLLILSNGSVEFTWRDPVAGSTRRATTSSRITDNEWHHLAGVFDQANGRNYIYLDGTEAASSNVSGTPYTGPEPVRFGARGSSGGGGSLSDLLTGDIDLVRITTGVRYSAAFTPPDLLHGGPKKQAVLLTWGLPPSGFVKDYQVYRQQLPAGSNTLVGTVPYAPVPNWLDVNTQTDFTYLYRVKARNSNNVAGPFSDSLEVVITPPTDVEADPPPLGRGPRLRIEPNPFNPSAVVRFRTETPGPVDLALYDARGRRLARLVHGVLPAGEHRVPVQPGGASRLASGVYFLQLAADGRTTRVKAVLVQ
jgi:hypothetical protein